jgi:23S rRNA pseudouridine2605 synthase
MQNSEQMRVQKYISLCGLASRREAEEMLAAGRVKVNGKPAKKGCKIDPTLDQVTVDGKKTAQSNEKVYIALNKPRGFITTLKDERGRKCVASLVSDCDARVYPIGRLDKDSEGLLLFSNDGDFTNRLTHPRHKVSKTYRVTLRGKTNEETLDLFRIGTELDGVKTLPAQANIVKTLPDRTVCEIVLSEGKNRQIRRIFEGAGIEVLRLKRIAVGGVKLGMLQTGKWRALSKDEIKSLHSAFRTNQQRVK